MQSVWPFQNKQEKIGRIYVESTKSFMYQVNYAYNSIDDVMVSVFAFIAVDREFEPQSVQKLLRAYVILCICLADFFVYIGARTSYIYQ